MMSSTTDTTPAVTGDGFTPRVTLARVIRSEWTKLITTRITLITMVIVFAIMSAGSIAISALSGVDTEASVNMATHSTMHAAFFTPMVVGVLGILVITIEYSTGTIQSSLLAVPKRAPLIVAKALVATVVVFVLIGLSSLVAFEVGRLVLLGQGLELSPVESESLGIVLGLTVAMAGFALLAFAIGALVKNTAGAVALWMLLLYVVPTVLGLIGGSIAEAVFPYLPTVLAGSISVDTSYADSMAPGLAMVILFGYGIIGTAIATVIIKRRDA